MQTYNDFRKQRSELVRDMQKNAEFDLEDIVSNDITMSAIPGVAAAGALYGLTGYIPKVKKYRSIRLLLAALGGAGVGYGMHAYLQSKNNKMDNLNKQLSGAQGAFQDSIDENARLRREHMQDLREAGTRAAAQDRRWQERYNDINNNWRNTINELNKTKSDLDASNFRASRAEDELHETRLKLERTRGELDALKGI